MTEQQSGGAMSEGRERVEADALFASRDEWLGPSVSIVHLWPTEGEGNG